MQRDGLGWRGSTTCLTACSLGFLELSSSHKFESGTSCLSHDVIALAEPGARLEKVVEVWRSA